MIDRTEIMGIKHKKSRVIESRGAWKLLKLASIKASSLTGEVFPQLKMASPPEAACSSTKIRVEIGRPDCWQTAGGEGKDHRSQPMTALILRASDADLHI